MRSLKEEDEEAYKKQFGQYIKLGVEADNIEKMYAEAHAAIRKNPTPKKQKAEEKEGEKDKKPKRFNKRKLNIKERRERVRQKKAKILSDLQKELAVADD